MSDQPRALYVGVRDDGRHHLTHDGYPRALRAYGWHADHLTEAEAEAAGPGSYDLIMWNGTIPESFLAAVDRGQTLVAMNGAGGDCLHYQRYADRITVATTSFNYFEEPPHGERRQIRLKHLATRQFLIEVRNGIRRRYARFASPEFWRSMGIELLYFPFASDPEVFHPLDVERDLRWCFVGQLGRRPLLERLEAESTRRGWRFEVYGPERRRLIPPSELNGLYNRCQVAFNVQNALHLGRELNERSIDVGMAGVPQVSDMGWMGRPELGESVAYYSERVGREDDFDRLVALMEQPPQADRGELHEHFRQCHSFDARLRKLSDWLGTDLTLGSRSS